jgi:putative metallohydrolase (TIGR04338 family)
VTERDSQRSKLYKAEQVLESFQKPLPTVKDIEHYITHNLKRKTLVRCYGNTLTRSIEVADGRGARRALAYGGTKIAIPLWARNDRIVLHEVAHIIHTRMTFRCNGERAGELRGGPAHGWQFAAVYLDLVRFCMGKEAGDALKKSFRMHKVRFSKPATRTLTDEQRAALVDRMAVARAAKNRQATP